MPNKEVSLLYEPLKEIAKAVGARGAHELAELHAWLFGEDTPTPADGEWRIAPSIVTRSEAELFGLSEPRFALRVYLGPGNGAFVNARPLGAFCDRARAWGQRISGRESRRNDLRSRWCFRRPAWHLRRNTCIADGLFPPRVGLEEYHILQAKLGRAYGEDSDTQTTPFVRHISLSGGGLCAQATCFMATALLHDYAKGVFGLAEVTALAHPRPAQELPLVGLSQHQIIAFFNSPYVNLNASWQRAEPMGGQEGPYHGHAKAFGNALATYLMSNMPVILPLDSHRMGGTDSPACRFEHGDRSILEANGIDIWRLPNVTDVVPSRHAVLLVGCKGTDAFLLNDPSHFPFMQASVWQLMDAACYTHGTDRLARKVFLPVTPHEVQLPLCDSLPKRQRGDGDQPIRPGLLWLARTLQSGVVPGLPRFATPYWPGQIRLATIEKLDSVADTVEPRHAEGVRKAQGMLLCRGWSDKHWCWVQAAEDSVWVWNAEMPPLRRPSLDVDAALGYLLCVLAYEGSAWQALGCRSAEARPDTSSRGTQVASAAATHLRASAISSFDARGIGRALQAWPHGASCELYAFMQKDADGLLPSGAHARLSAVSQYLRYTAVAHLKNRLRAVRLRAQPAGVQTSSHDSAGKLGWRPRPRYPTAVVSPVVTPVEKMAWLAGKPKLVGRVADLLAGGFAAKGIDCAALATFVPELIASGRESRRARAALSFTIELAHALRERGQSIETIEIVAGSTMDRVWLAKSTQPALRGRQPIYVANRLSVEDGMDRLLAALGPLAEKARDHGVRFALELEPGPLYLLGTWQALVALCEQLEMRPEFVDVIGLNLDVAHWRLAGISADQVRGCEEVRRRIVHCHISDHGRGHFGDVPLGWITPVDEVKDWVDLVRGIAAENRPAPYPPFAGYLSVELEAAKHSDFVRNSVALLSEML